MGFGVHSALVLSVSLENRAPDIVDAKYPAITGEEIKSVRGARDYLVQLMGPAKE